MDIVIELLLKEKDNLLARLAEVEDSLLKNGYNQSSGTSSAILSKSKEVNDAFNGKPLKQQVWDAITMLNRFVFNSEITEVLLPYYSSIEENQLKSKIASEFGNIRKESDVLVKVQFGVSYKDTVWGKKQWLDDKGNIKPEFSFKPKNDKRKRKIVFA